MKITKCDRCGKEFVGRNPWGFYEHVLDQRVYIDLCSECNKDYLDVVRSMEENNRKIIEKFLDTFISRKENNNEN